MTHCDFDYCSKTETKLYKGGLFFCEEHMQRVLEHDATNIELIEKQEDMASMNIKRGSIQWFIGILQVLKKTKKEFRWNDGLVFNRFIAYIYVFYLEK